MKLLQLDCLWVTSWDLVGTPSQLGRISNLRPFLDSSDQTTLGKVLDIFRKISKRARYVVFKKRCFQRAFRHKIGPLSPNRCFSESDAQYERKSSKIGLFIEENRARTKLSLVRANTIYRAHANHLTSLTN